MQHRNFPLPRGHAEQGRFATPSAAERLNPYAASHSSSVHATSESTFAETLTDASAVTTAKYGYHNMTEPSPLNSKLEQPSVRASPISPSTSLEWTRYREAAPPHTHQSALGKAPEFVAIPSKRPLPVQNYSRTISNERSKSVGVEGPSSDGFSHSDINLSSSPAGYSASVGEFKPSKTPFPTIEESNRAGQAASVSASNPMSNALAQMVMSSVADRVGMDSIPMSKLHAFFPSAVTMLRQYFNVSHRYVFKKLVILLCPYLFLIHFSWKLPSTRTRFAGQASSQHDIVEEDQMHEESENLLVMKRADLYIPLMALITYILAIGLTKGTSSNDFRPDVLGSAATFSLTLITLEVIVAKAAFYLSGNSRISVVDLIAYSGYKFVHLVFIICVGILIALNSSASLDITGTQHRLSSGGRLMKGSTYTPGLKYKGTDDSLENKATSMDASLLPFPKNMNRHYSTLFWCCFFYFTICAAIEMMQCLAKPMQTRTASELELHVRRSSTYYIAWILAFAQIPLCYFLMPSMSL